MPLTPSQWQSATRLRRRCSRLPSTYGPFRWTAGGAVLVLAAVGCTPGSVRSGGYAGMDMGEAQREVVDYARQEMIAPAGPLTRHRLQLQRLYRGKTSKGDDAWVGRFEDETAHSPVCVRVWKTDETIVSEDFSAEIDDCALDKGPPPPPLS